MLFLQKFPFKHSQSNQRHKTSVYHFLDDPSDEQFVHDPYDSVEFSVQNEKKG